jgi:RNA recognition motif-containing protein
MNKRLYVENLPATVTESDLRALFSQKGPVTDVKLLLDVTTGLSRGRAFITMATPELAQLALKSLHSHSLGGRNIAVTEARPETETKTGLIGQGFEVGIGKFSPANDRQPPRPQRHQRPRGGPKRPRRRR